MGDSLRTRPLSQIRGGRGGGGGGEERGRGKTEQDSRSNEGNTRRAVTRGCPQSAWRVLLFQSRSCHVRWP